MENRNSDNNGSGIALLAIAGVLGFAWYKGQGVSNANAGASATVVKDPVTQIGDGFKTIVSDIKMALGGDKTVTPVTPKPSLPIANDVIKDQPVIEPWNPETVVIGEPGNTIAPGEHSGGSGSLCLQSNGELTPEQIIIYS